MVAVALSAEVRPLPMDHRQQQPVEELQQHTGGTGIDSVDDHIARLKANARQHVDRELLASGNASPRAGKTPYLPSKEVAKTIKCRYFPNCYYGDKCMFFHPASLETYAASGDHVNGYVRGPSSMNGHVYSGNGHASPSHINGDVPLSPTSNGHSGEEYGNAYDMAYNPQAQAAQNGQQGYYIPAGYEGQAEYMPYPPQMFSPPPPQSQHQPSHSQSTNGQAQQQASSNASQQQQASAANPYYGFVPYGPHGAYAYPAQPQYPYYPQQNGGYPGMYMPPPSMQSHDEQQQVNGSSADPTSPVNGVVSPSSSSAAIPDPAILAQGPESQDTGSSVPAAAGLANGSATDASASTSTGMEKSSSAQSGKSSSSSKSKKAKKAAAEQAAAAGIPAVNGAISPSTGEYENLPQNGDFVPMPYYPMGAVPMNLPGMPSEMMMMPPPMPHIHHQHALAQGQHFQPQAYGTFGSPLHGQAAQLEGGEFSNKEASSPQQNGTEPSEKKHQQANGHERTPSASAPGQMHTFFQTSGGAARAAPSQSNGPRSTAANGGPSGTRFNPSSSTNGNKRLPPSSYATNGVLLPRSGPVNGPPSMRRIPYDSNKPTLPCRFFETRSCRHGDLCHYTHLLIEERVIPNHADGKLTRDARLLGLNIGSPDGRISENTPRNPTDFNGNSSNGPSRRPPVLNAGQGQQQSAQNGPNGFGMPQVNAKGRFVHPPQPSTQAFAAQQMQQQLRQAQPAQAQQQQQQQQQKEQQIAALANDNGADAQEKIQRLISETRNLPSSMPPSTNVAPRPNTTRANGIPPTLGRRPPPAHRNAGPASSTAQHASHQQRVPSGENDFPALSSSTSPAVGSGNGKATSSMERTTSSSSSSEKKVETAPPTASAKVAAASDTTTTEAKKEDVTASQVANQASASNPAPTSAAAPSAAAAPAKPFSWASAAAKAASLPTPPPKRPVSKQRPSAAANASTKEKDGKGEKAAGKAEKAQKDAGKKDADKENTAQAPSSTSTTLAEPATTAAKIVATESTAISTVKA